MRRSLLLTGDFPPMAGGIARLLGEIARAAPEGSLLVSTGRVAGDETADTIAGCRVDRLDVPSGRLRTLPGLMAWAWRARRLITEHAPEFLWAGNIKPAGHVVRWLGARRRIPYGLLVYGLDIQRLEAQARHSALKRRTAQAIVSRAAGAVAISDWTAERYREVARMLGQGGAAERVRVIRPGVDAERFRPGLETEAIRARYGLDRRPWLLTVARLVAHKGIALGIEVVGRLREAGLDVGYMIAGNGPERETLERQAAATGLAGQVRFLGAVPDADLPSLYCLAAAYVGLSRPRGLEVEGFGLAYLEAAACGLPVVAGLGGGTTDAVADGITGHLVPADSAGPAIRALGELLRDPARAQALGSAGRTRVEREFSWRRVVRELEAAAAAFSDGLEPRGGH